MDINTTSMQNDGGANRSVTNQRHILINCEEITPYPISGVNGKIQRTAKDFIPWTLEQGSIILVPCYYSSQVNGTIVSPTDLVEHNKQRYSGWRMTTDLDHGIGEFELLAQHGVNHLSFVAYSQNNLWYHHSHQFNNHNMDTLPQIISLTDGAEMCDMFSMSPLVSCNLYGEKLAVHGV